MRVTDGVTGATGDGAGRSPVKSNPRTAGLSGAVVCTGRAGSGGAGFRPEKSNPPVVGA